MSPFDRNDAALAQYLDGELPPDQASHIRQHIRECPRCAAEVSVLVSMKRDLHAAKYHFSPRAPFKRKIQQQVSRWPNSKWNTRLVWAFAVLLLPSSFPLSGWKCRAALTHSAKSRTSTNQFYQPAPQTTV